MPSVATSPELVAPVGNWSALWTVVSNGADSVYFGVKGLNMRHEADNFDILEIKKIMRFVREHQKKGYLALNTILMDADISRVRKTLKAARGAGVDAVILWDMAALKLAKDEGLRVHVSTQASVSNFEALKFWAGLGAQRVVLARECTLKDIKSIIKQIKAEGLACEIEAFIHGAMCVSVSGRCFMSLLSFGKSANRGRCIQPCRREFHISDVDREAEYRLGSDYVLSPKDLCAMDFIDQLIKSGIHSFKIEGRLRPPEYLKVVTRSYRSAIDAYYKKKLTAQEKEKLKADLERVYNRGFSSGFYFGQPQQATSRRLEHTHEKIFLGEVTRYFKRISVAEVRLRNGNVSQGTQLLFAGKTSPANVMVVEQMQQEKKDVQNAVKGEIVGIKTPFTVKPKDKVFVWRERADG